MIDFESNMSEPSRRLNDLVVVDDYNEDAMSELATTMSSVTTTDCEDKIYNNVPEVFAGPQSSDQYLNPSSDVAFFKAINLRGYISKLRM